MAWRNCNASLRLVEAVNAKWPNRSKASDGTVGDAAHATRTSDHNPWVVVAGQGVVRARDITRAGTDLPWLFEHLRVMGQRGDPRLAGGGYLIWDRRITAPNFSGWRAYTGSNPHIQHGHVSFSRNRAGFDSNTPWTFGQPVPAQEDDDMPSPQEIAHAVWEHPVTNAWGQVVPAAVVLTAHEGITADTRSKVEALHQVITGMAAGSTAAVDGGPGALSVTDVDRIANRVADLLADRLTP